MECTVSFMSDTLEEFLADDDALIAAETFLVEDEDEDLDEWLAPETCPACGTAYDYADSRYLGETCGECGAFESAWPDAEHRFLG